MCMIIIIYVYYYFVHLAHTSIAGDYDVRLFNVPIGQGESISF